MGSAGSVLKSERRSEGPEGGVGGGICSASRSKNWEKEGCFSLSLKSRRETGESQALSRDCGFTIRHQRLSAALTERQRWLRDTEWEGQSEGLHPETEVSLLPEGGLRKRGSNRRITKRVPPGNCRRSRSTRIYRRIPSWPSN